MKRTTKTEAKTLTSTSPEREALVSHYTEERLRREMRGVLRDAVTVGTGVLLDGSHVALEEVLEPAPKTGKKVTSPELGALASLYVNLQAVDVPAGNASHLRAFAADVRSLAASVLSQVEK